MSIGTKQAVSIAKAWVAEQLGDEGIQDIGLEEVRHDDQSWQITIGFSRPWDRVESNPIATWATGLPPSRQRSYKVLVIADDTGEVIEMKNRQAA